MLGVQMHELAMAARSLYSIGLIAMGLFGTGHSSEPMTEMELIRQTLALRV